MMTSHQSHPEIVKRLKRAAGHLKSIIDMLEDDRECLEVAQQLQAVEKAISSAKKTLVHDHIDHCLEHAVKKGARNAGATVSEFKEITKYL
jgi:DNA-binding FrmR family transcriptional regulator